MTVDAAEDHAKLLLLLLPLRGVNPFTSDMLLLLMFLLRLFLVLSTSRVVVSLLMVSVVAEGARIILALLSPSESKESEKIM